MAFLHRTLPRGALPAAKRATKWEREIASRRFWRRDVFLPAYPGCHRGMFYSLLIHFALLSVLIASPVAIPQSGVTAESYLMPLDSPSDSPAPVSTASYGHGHLPPSGNAPDLLRPTSNSLQPAPRHEPYSNDSSAESTKPFFAREFRSPAGHTHVPTCFLVFECALRHKCRRRTPSYARTRRVHPRGSTRRGTSRSRRPRHRRGC